jgi:hypothetical protein
MNFSKLLEVAEDTISLVKTGIDTTHNFIDESEEIAETIKESVDSEEDEDDQDE